MAASITKINKPNVMRLIGKEMTNKSGRIKVFVNPNINEIKNPCPILLISIPGRKNAANITAHVCIKNEINTPKIPEEEPAKMSVFANNN